MFSGELCTVEQLWSLCRVPPNDAPSLEQAAPPDGQVASTSDSAFTFRGKELAQWQVPGKSLEASQAGAAAVHLRLEDARDAYQEMGADSLKRAAKRQQVVKDHGLQQGFMEMLKSLLNKPRKNKKGEAIEDSTQDLINFANLIGITIEEKHLQGTIFSKCVPKLDTIVGSFWVLHCWNSLSSALDASALICSQAPTEVDSLMNVLKLALTAARTPPKATRTAYVRHLSAFLIWLHMRHPECFRRTEVRNVRQLCL